MSGALPNEPAPDTESGQLEVLYTENHSWRELVELLLSRAERVGKSPERVKLLRRVSELFVDRIGDTDSALVTLQAAFREDFGNDEVAGELEELVARMGRWKDLLSEHTQLVNQLGDRRQAADLWVRIAGWYDRRLNRPDYAMSSVQQALAIDPAHARALAQMAALYRRQESWGELAGTLATMAGLPTVEGEQAADIRLELAEVMEERLGDVEGAIQAYQAVLAVDARNRPALAALSRLYEGSGHAEDQVQVLERELDTVTTDGERVEILRRLAKLYEDSGRPDRTCQALEKVLQLDPRNQRAVRDLERLYRQAEAWELLVEIYRKHALAARDDEERAWVAYGMAKVHEEHLGDLDRAMAGYNEVLAVAPAHVEALTALAGLYDRAGRGAETVDVMGRLLRVVDDPRFKVELHFRIGQILRSELDDPATAEEHLSAALGLDPAHLGAMSGLIDLYRRRGDWLKAAQLMVRAENHTDDTAEKIHLLFDAATIFHDRLNDADRAGELYARTLEIDPRNLAAAEPLSQIHADRQEWAAVLPLGEMLIANGASMSIPEMAVVHARLAKAAEKLGDPQKALAHYRSAYDLNPDMPEMLLDWGMLLSDCERWGEACRIFEFLLSTPTAMRSDAQVLEMAFRLARGRMALGDKAGAVEMLRRVRAIDPGHRAAIEALIGVQTELGDFHAVLECKRALLARAADAEEKFALQCQIAELCRDRLQDPRQALAAYLDALDLKPSAHQILHEVLELLTATKQWKDAVQVLLTLADVDKDKGADKAKVRARYLVAAANILNYELHSYDEAVQLYNQALDEDGDDLKTFERIDRILTAKRDWKEQERAYRRMIKRLGPEPGPDKKVTQLTLWRGLAEICRSRLGDVEAATMAFEVCAKLDGGDLTYNQILGELYDKSGPQAYGRAIEQHRTLFLHAPHAVERTRELRTLRRLYLATGQYDRAWCVGSALVAIGQADAEEHTFHERYRVEGFVRPQSPLTEEQWQRHVFHPDEDRRVSQVFAAVSQSVALVRAKDRKEWGLRPKDRQDPTQDRTLFSRVLRYATMVLGVPRPDLYLLPDVPGALDMANVRDHYLLVPAFVVGGSLLSGRSEKDLACVIGKKLALMRPDHFVLWPHVVPTLAELRVIYLTVLRVLGQDIFIEPAAEEAVGRYTELFRRSVPPQAIEQLSAIVPRMGDTEPDFGRWSQAVELTTNRAALLICNDLELLVRYVQGEPEVPGAVDANEKIRDLVLWSTSDEYFALREHVGLNIDRRG